MTLALSCTSPADMSLSLPTAANKAEAPLAEEPGAALRWCTSRLADIDWEALPNEVLDAYQAASRQCQLLTNSNTRLLNLGMLAFALLGNDLPIVSPPESSNEQVALLVQLGIAEQQVVSYAAASEDCSTDAAGSALLRIGFAEGGLARFAPNADASMQRLIESGARMTGVGGGTAVSFPSKGGSHCETTLLIGDDELVLHEGPAGTDLEALVVAARAQAGAAPGEVAP